MGNKIAEKTRSFTRASPDQRKKELIQATLELISAKGVHAATVRAIARKANVSQGLIRHHFSSKEELVSAAYEFHMQEMMTTSFKTAELSADTAVKRLARFINDTLMPPVVDHQTVAIWAGFLQLIQHNPRIRTIHEKTYLLFRDRIELLIGDAIEEQGGRINAIELRTLAIACNAVIDGLWLEGGALYDRFSNGELADIGLMSISRILGIDFGDFRGEK